MCVLVVLALGSFGLHILVSNSNQPAAFFGEVARKDSKVLTSFSMALMFREGHLGFRLRDAIWCSVSLQDWLVSFGSWSLPIAAKAHRGMSNACFPFFSSAAKVACVAWLLSEKKALLVGGATIEADAGCRGD